MQFRSIQLILAHFLLFVSPSAHADTPDPIISLAVNEWPPYTTSSLDNGGLVIDLLTAAFKEQGYQIKWNVMPWNRVKAQVKTLSVDGTTAWYTERRIQDYLYSDPILENKLVIVKRRGMHVQWESVTDLQSYTFALLRGSATSQEFDNSDRIIKFFVPEQKNAIKMVANKRVDMAIIDEQMIKHLLHTSLKRYENFVESVQPPLASRQLHFIVSQAHPRGEKLIDAFNTGMRALKDQGTYNSLLKSYGVLKD